MMIFIKSKNGKYLYAQHNPSIRAVILNGEPAVYGGGITDFGEQQIQHNYYDPLDSDEFDRRNTNVQPVGIYLGGLLEQVSDVAVKVHPVVVEISDGTYQARVRTTSVVNATLTVGSATPYIVLRWAWVGIAARYMDMLAVALGGIQTNDVVVGQCVYSGVTMTGIDYTLRTIPKTIEMMLKVLEIVPPTLPDMKVFVNNGWINYGSSRIAVKGQISPAMAAAGAGNARIDLIYVDASGNVQVSTGVEDPAPVAPSHVGKLVLAEILFDAATAEITQDMITDARQWLLHIVAPSDFISGDFLLTSNTGLRTGWTDVSDEAVYKDKFMRISSGVPLVVGGSDTHKHGVGTYKGPSHRHLVSGNTASTAYNTCSDEDGACSHAAMTTHLHAVSINSQYSGTGAVTGESAVADNIPAYVQMRMYKKD